MPAKAMIATMTQCLVSQHPWKAQSSNQLKLKAARKERDRRYWRNYHRDKVGTPHDAPLQKNGRPRSAS